MSIDYRIKAYPTEYRGRVYRSRLEARWAAFFDLLGWRHEYEPMDLGRWSPDFLLRDFGMLVEVKPVTDLDAETFDRMVDACIERGFDGEESDINWVCQLGVAPFRENRTCQLGWWSAIRDASPCPAQLVWTPSYKVPGIKPEIATLLPGDCFCTSSGDAGEWDNDWARRPLHYPDHAAELWARASGVVQWKPKK